jgi:hypothetical protein
MKKLAAFCLILVASLPAFGVEGDQVMYVGGTTSHMKARIVGMLDTSSDTALIFNYSGSKLEIPYASIESSQYTQEVTRHLGVLPAMAVGMIAKRRHRHFFRISYRDPNNAAQVAVFEVPKHMPRTLQAVLEARAAQTCKPYLPCAGRN